MHVFLYIKYIKYLASQNRLLHWYICIPTPVMDSLRHEPSLPLSPNANLMGNPSWVGRGCFLYKCIYGSAAGMGYYTYKASQYINETCVIHKNTNVNSNTKERVSTFYYLRNRVQTMEILNSLMATVHRITSPIQTVKDYFLKRYVPASYNYFLCPLTCMI